LGHISNEIEGDSSGSDSSNIAKYPVFEVYVLIFIVFVAMQPPSLFLLGRTCVSAGGQKALQCILQLSKCPPADAHMCGAMETKMAAGWEYDYGNQDGSRLGIR
jgi:putative ribosome biogenesis GTPase RsgA